MTQGVFFRVGLLIVVGAVLGIGLVWFLGGEQFSHGVLLETYFKESVQGLDIGAPVKYRGVTLGRVTNIGLVNAEYDTGQPVNINESIYQLVFVRYLVDPAKIGQGISLEVAVKQGLRARLAAQGITGLSYIELDFTDPERYPVEKVPWEPKGEHIPSMPSTLTQVQNAAQDVLARLSKVDFDTLARELTGLVADLRREVTSGGAHQALQQISILLETLRDSVEAADLPGLTANLQRTSDAARAVLQNKDINRTLASTAQIADHLARVTAELPPLIANLQAIARRSDASVADVQQALEPLLRDMQATTENLRETTEELRRYPAQILLNKPPPRMPESVR